MSASCCHRVFEGSVIPRELRTPYEQIKLQQITAGPLEVIASFGGEISPDWTRQVALCLD
jgi:hypothetical protein